jgi:hypothetical protein
MQPFVLKNLPIPVQALIRPMLLISLGLHGLLLITPISSQKEQKFSEQKKVKVTQLSSSQPSAAKPKAKPTSQVRKPVRRAIQPVVRPRTTFIPAEAPPALKAPQAQSEPMQLKPEPTPSSPEATQNPFADFPHYPGAEPGCFELQSCYKAGATLSSVTTHFEKTLPAKEFKIHLHLSEPNRKVYQVAKEDIAQYLSVIATQDQSVVYVLADQPRSSQDLKQAVEVPAEFYTLLAGVNAESADDSHFANPSLFYAKLGETSPEGFVLTPEPRPETDGAFKLIQDQTPAEVYNTYFAPTQQDYFQVSQVGSYGGGGVYKLQKDKFTGYVNLLPSKDGAGTIVVLWNKSPV